MASLHLRSMMLAMVAAGGMVVGGCQRSESTAMADEGIDRAAVVVAANAEGAQRAAETLVCAAGAAAAAAGDAALTAKVKSALFSELELSALRIRVVTNNAIVTLSGPEVSPVERARAVRAALGVAGVRFLLDGLDVPLGEGG